MIELLRPLICDSVMQVVGLMVRAGKDAEKLDVHLAPQLSFLRVCVDRATNNTSPPDPQVRAVQQDNCGVHR